MPAPPAIAQFFDIYSLPSAMRDMHKLFRFANSNKVWNGKFPGNLLFLCEHLQQLSDAVYELNIYEKNAKIGHLDYAADPYWPMNHPASFCYKYKYQAWDYFPRHLSRKQFINPYEALYRFRKCQHQHSWRLTLKVLLELALSGSHYSDMDEAIPLRKAERMLYRLVEACHLILVRTAGDKEPETVEKVQEAEQVEVHEQQ